MTDKTRVSIFIDGSNFYHSLKKANIRIRTSEKYKELIKRLVKDRILVNIFYYNASLDITFNSKKYWKQQKFFEKLKNLGFKVILCKLRKHKTPEGKIWFDVKGDDVHLTVDLISGAYENLYDTAIIISGDEDFIPAIKKIQELDKKVENAYFKLSSSNALKKSCDSSICLNEMLKNINCPVLPKDHTGEDININ